MKRVLLLAAVLCVAGLALGSTLALAQVGNHPDARFALHSKTQVSGKTAPAVCPDFAGGTNQSPNGLNIACSLYDTHAPLGAPSYPLQEWAYLMVGQLSPSFGVGGVSFGVNYPSPTLYVGESAEWGLVYCADGNTYPSTSPAWPLPGSGITITWLTCSPGVTTKVISPDNGHAVIGKFYVYAYGECTLAMTPNYTKTSGDELDVADCGGINTKLLSLTDPSLWDALCGVIHFGGNGSLGYTPCGVVSTKPSTWGRLKTLFQEEAE
jgi:hypothetical protein